MSECFLLDSSHLEDVIQAHLETWEASSLSVQLGPTFLKAFYNLAIEDPATIAVGIRQSHDAQISSWCLGFRQYSAFNATLKKRLGLSLYFLVAKKVLTGTISIGQVVDNILGNDQARSVKCPENHLGAFGCIGKNFEDVLLLTKLIAYTAAQLCETESACWAVTNDTNKGGKMVMKRAGFSQIDEIQTKDRTLGIYEFSSGT
ncbi:hypothetical protein V5T82_09080 [Magnetovibrio sp. PR-2]|uniref:hypothetical protein n=1 Tax=Magnetovibrio sp. PR-2 TaxID=3120356 RepID=UPI002FCE155D